MCFSPEEVVGVTSFNSILKASVKFPTGSRQKTLNTSDTFSYAYNKRRNSVNVATILLLHSKSTRFIYTYFIIII